jgi:hypothetical protein
MGYSIGWLAVQTTDARAVHEALQVSPTMRTDEYFESPIAGVSLASGWLLFVAEDSERLIARERLTKISQNWTCLACLVEEHVMCSSAALWSNGAEVWSVSHDPGQGILHLDTRGSLPDSFASVQESMLREQRTLDAEGDGDVDYIFDVPLLIAKHITGFKHDEPMNGSLAAPDKPVAFSDEAPKKRRWLPW